MHMQRFDSLREADNNNSIIIVMYELCMIFRGSVFIFA